MNKVIVFDVDKTLISGHLMRRFFLQVIYVSPLSFFYLSALALRTLPHVVYQLPRILRSAFSTSDYQTLDLQLQKHARHFYSSVFKLLERIKIDAHARQKIATRVVEKLNHRDFIQPGMKELRSHMGKKGHIIVLASGSLHEIICALKIRFEQEFKTAEKKVQLFACGTTQQITMVGSAKLDWVRALFNTTRNETFTLEQVYSDNQFFADLPLIESARRVTIITAYRSQLYAFLGDEVRSKIEFIDDK